MDFDSDKRPETLKYQKDINNILSLYDNDGRDIILDLFVKAYNSGESYEDVIEIIEAKRGENND